MPHPELDRKQRDALFNLTLLELSHMDDLALSLEQSDETTAKRHRQRLEDCFALLDDLGWQQPTDQATFALTMDQPTLRRVIQHLAEQAIEALRFDAEELRIATEQRSNDAIHVLSAAVALLKDREPGLPTA